jgi:hypothetical protein
MTLKKLNIKLTKIQCKKKNKITIEQSDGADRVPR